MTKLLTSLFLLLALDVNANSDNDDHSENHGDKIRLETNLSRTTNPIFEAAWATNKYGFLNYWDEKLERRSPQL